jgi:peptide deformylase
MKDILKEGNPILREKCEEIALPLSKDEEKTIQDMIEYLRNSQDEELSKKYGIRPGVGLAAPQIGINKKMLVILSYDEEGKLHFYPMINPKLISYSEEKTYLEGGEGCLSVDRNVKGLVHRAKRVTVETYLYTENKLLHVRLRLKGYIAVIFQHEYDHLNGILFVDRINKNNPFEIVANSTPIQFKDSE